MRMTIYVFCWMVILSLGAGFRSRGSQELGSRCVQFRPQTLRAFQVLTFKPSGSKAHGGSLPEIPETVDTIHRSVLMPWCVRAHISAPEKAKDTSGFIPIHRKSLKSLVSQTSFCDEAAKPLQLHQKTDPICSAFNVESRSLVHCSGHQCGLDVRLAGGPKPLPPSS